MHIKGKMCVVTPGHACSHCGVRQNMYNNVKAEIILQPDKKHKKSELGVQVVGNGHDSEYDTVMTREKEYGIDEPRENISQRTLMCLHQCQHQCIRS